MILGLDPAVGTLVAAVVAAFAMFATGFHRARTVDRKAIEHDDYLMLFDETRKLRSEQQEANHREIEAARRELLLEGEIRDLKAQVAAAMVEIEALKKDSATEIEVLKREVSFWRDRASNTGK